MITKMFKIGCLMTVLGLLSFPAWSANEAQIMSADNPLMIAHEGNGPGDGTGNGGDGPADGTGNGPGDCGSVNTNNTLMFLASGGKAGSGDNGGNGPGDGMGNDGEGPEDGTGNGSGNGNEGSGDNGGNGPGDGIGNDGDGPADGSGNGPGDCIAI